MPLQNKTNIPKPKKPFNVISARNLHDSSIISMYTAYIPSFFATLLAYEVTYPNPCLNYIVTFHGKLNLSSDTLYLSIYIVNSILKIRTLSPCKEKLLVITSLFIASKYEEVFPPHISAFIHECTDADVMRAEKYILHLLDYNLNFSNPLNFLRHACKADNYNKERKLIAEFILEKCVVAGTVSRHSKVAVGAVYMAWKITKFNGDEDVLFHYSPFGKSEILKVLDEIFAVFLKGVCVVEEKYKKKEFGCVSAKVARFFRCE